MKRQAEALHSYDRAVAIEPSYHQAWFNRALLLTEMAAYGNAVESYDRAIALNPDPIYQHGKAALWLKHKLT
jgi:tetratricopeptide (TPR) repeat protein